MLKEITDPDNFVKGKFQDVLKANNYKIYDDLIKENVFTKYGINNKGQFIQKINNLESDWYLNIKVE